MATAVGERESWVLIVGNDAFRKPGYHARASGVLRPVGSTLRVHLLLVLLAEGTYAIGCDSAIAATVAGVHLKR